MVGRPETYIDVKNLSSQGGGGPRFYWPDSIYLSKEENTLIISSLYMGNIILQAWISVELLTLYLTFIITSSVLQLKIAVGVKVMLDSVILSILLKRLSE